jgi:hypothetical protein
MDTSAQSAKLSNSTRAVVFISRLALPVAVSLLLVGCDTTQTEGPSRANAFPSKSTAYERASAAPPPAVSDDADTNADTNAVQSVVTITPKKPTPPTPQPAPVAVQKQQSRTVEAPVASAAPVKASEKLVTSKAPMTSKAPVTSRAPASANASERQKIAGAPPVASAPQAAPGATPIEALIVKGPPRPVKQHAQGVGKVVWVGLAVFGAAVLLFGTRVSVDRAPKVSVPRRNKKSRRAARGNDDVVLPPELEMREPTGL